MNQYYRHFKGNVYRVLHIAKHSETLEDMVVYQAMYGERGIWVRPLAMFEEVIERDGNTFRRFEEISAEEAEGLALDYDRTHKGVQAILQDEAKGRYIHAQNEGVTQVRLYVDKDNQKAQSVYQKLGMSECHYLMYEVEL